MKEFLGVFDEQKKWWRSLTSKEKAYTIYFFASLYLVLFMAYAPVWMMLVAVLNFGNSVRLIKRVPIDKLEED